MSGSPSASGSAPTVDSSSTYQLAVEGQFTVGYRASDLIDVTDDGEVTGYLGLMASEIQERLGLEPNYVPMGFAATFAALQAGRIDMSYSMAATQPRAQVLYPVFPVQLFGPTVLAVKPGTPAADVQTWAEAKELGLTLATIKGFYFISQWEELGIDFHAFDNDDECLTDLTLGGADGCALNATSLPLRQAADPTGPLAELENIVITGPGVLWDLTTFGVARHNPSLANDISQIMKDLWRDGTVEESYARKFGDLDYSLFIDPPPPGTTSYMPGPWEEGVTPPAPETFTTPTTVAAGELTVGVVGDSAMLSLEGERLVGPEAQVLEFAADRLGLTLRGVGIEDEAAALRDDEVDLIAGQLATTRDRVSEYWMTGPLGFSPDYMYVKADDAGALPPYKTWEDVEGTIGIVSDSPRLAELEEAGVEVQEFDTAEAGLEAVVDGDIAAYVGATTDYVEAASQSEDVASTVGFVRNTNRQAYGEAFAWGTKAGNAQLIDALDQAITMAWQQGIIASAYRDAWPGVNVDGLLAPGPGVIGTSFGTSKDYNLVGIFVSGAWLQRPGYGE